MNNTIKVRCRIAGQNGNGDYLLHSSNDAYRFLRGCYDSYNTSGIVKEPYNEVSFSFDYKDHSVKDLHNAILKSFGLDIKIPEIIEEDMICGWPELLIEAGSNFIIGFDDENIKLAYVIEKYRLFNIEAFLALILGRGDLFREDGFRFYIPSHEGNKHNRPHVHVETSNHRNGSVDILTLEQNKGSRLKRHEMTKIRKIMYDKQDLLLEAWNAKTDGIDVDINILLEQAKIQR